MARDRDDGGTGWTDEIAPGQGGACKGFAFVTIPDEPPSMAAGTTFLARCDDESHKHQIVTCTSPTGETRRYDIRDSHPHGDDKPFIGLSRLCSRWDAERVCVPRIQARYGPPARHEPVDSEITLPPRKKGAGGWRQAAVGSIRSALHEARRQDVQLEELQRRRAEAEARERQREPGDDDDEAPFPEDMP